MNESFDIKKPQHLITVFLAVFILLTIPLTVISVLNQRDERSQAANTTALYLQPATSSVAVNGALVVNVRENSGTTAVHAAEILLTYDTSKLTYISADAASTTDFKQDISAPFESSPGSIYFVRSVLQPATCPTPPCSTTVTGDKLLATLRFTAKTVAGAAAINFDNLSTIEGPAGNETSTRTGGTYTVTDTPPTVSLTAPAASAFVAGSTVTVSADATDNLGVVGVEFYDGATMIGSRDTTATGNSYSVVWNTSTATAGNHTLTARAFDINGSTVSAARTVTVDNTIPTTPVVTGLTTKVQNTVALTATSTDTNLDRIEFRVDGGAPTIDNTAPTYSFNWNTIGLTNTTHTLTVIAVDKANNPSATFSQVVTVDNQGPSAFTVSGTVVGQNQINLTWTTSTDALSGPVSYDVYRNGTKITTTSLPAATTSYSATGLTAGTAYTFYVIAKDTMPTPNTTQTTNTLSLTTQAPWLPGDYNQDNTVGVGDLTLLINNWASTTNLQADGNTSLKIDIGDLTILINNWGRTNP